MEGPDLIPGGENPGFEGNTDVDAPGERPVLGPGDADFRLPVRLDGQRGLSAFGDLPELVENRRVVAINWDGVETDVPNVAGGATLSFNVPGRFVDGHGEWIVFFGATDDPLSRVHAAEARS